MPLANRLAPRGLVQCPVRDVPDANLTRDGKGFVHDYKVDLGMYCRLGLLLR
jgi:hypothetical protein